MTTELRKTQFESNLNTEFRFCYETGEAPLELIEVKSATFSPKYEYFSLVFRGDKSQVHPQGTYPVKHMKMGEFDLFVTPVGRSDEGTFYEAVFNRLVDQGEVRR